MTRPARGDPAGTRGRDLAAEVEAWCRLRLTPRIRPLTLATAGALLADALRAPDPQPGLATVRFGRTSHLQVVGTELTRCGRTLPALVATAPGGLVTCTDGCALPPEAD